jgi:hypothetical protein
VTDNPYTIDFDSLPEEYFIKANHGCGWNLFGKDGEIYNFKYGKDVNNDLNYANCRITREECIRLCKKWLKRRYSHREWAYRNIEPKIMIEESLVQKDGDFLIDYRCHTFNGVVKAIEIDSPMFRDNEGMIVDRNGRPFKLTRYKYKYPDPPHEIPGNFREIIRAAETLGKELDYIRVDLYNTTKGIALGEMTIYLMGPAGNLLFALLIFIVSTNVYLPKAEFFIFYNLLLACVNLIPAYPLDAARAAAAVLRRAFGAVSAVRIMAYVSYLISILSFLRDCICSLLKRTTCC